MKLKPSDSTALANMSWKRYFSMLQTSQRCRKTSSKHKHFTKTSFWQHWCHLITLSRRRSLLSMSTRIWDWSSACCSRLSKQRWNLSMVSYTWKCSGKESWTSWKLLRNQRSWTWRVKSSWILQRSSCTTTSSRCTTSTTSTIQQRWDSTTCWNEPTKRRTVSGQSLLRRLSSTSSLLITSWVRRLSTAKQTN